jgi:hypothetical protein
MARWFMHPGQVARTFPASILTRSARNAAALFSAEVPKPFAPNSHCAFTTISSPLYFTLAAGFASNEKPTG